MCQCLRRKFFKWFYFFNGGGRRGRPEAGRRNRRHGNRTIKEREGFLLFSAEQDNRNLKSGLIPTPANQTQPSQNAAIILSRRGGGAKRTPSTITFDLSSRNSLLHNHNVSLKASSDGGISDLAPPPISCRKSSALAAALVFQRLALTDRCYRAAAAQ